MKCVCISCFDYYDIRMKKILQFFQDKNFDTTYIISDFNHFSKSYNDKECKYENTYKIHVPSYNKNLSVKRLYSHMYFSKKVYEKIVEIEPDIIYCIFPPNMLVRELDRYKKNHKSKVILDRYDTWPESFPVGKYERLLKIPFSIWRNLRDKHIDVADLLITVCEKGKIECNEKYPDKITKVLYPYIEPGMIPLYTFDVEEEITFGYLGNINFITNIPLLTNFLYEVSKYKKVVLHIIGGGQKLDELVDSLKNENIKVISHGPIFDEEKKNEIFSECDFGLNLPYEKINSAMALKYIEYLKVGLPIINSGVGDNYYITKENKVGFNINEDSIESLAKKLVKLSSEDINTIHNNCLLVYRNKFVEQKFEEIFKNIL